VIDAFATEHEIYPKRGYGLRAMSELNRRKRFQVQLRHEEIRAVDDWRFARKMPSRAAAIRELLRLGLAAEEAPAEDNGKSSKRRRASPA